MVVSWWIVAFLCCVVCPALDTLKYLKEFPEVANKWHVTLLALLFTVL